MTQLFAEQHDDGRLCVIHSTSSLRPLKLTLDELLGDTWVSQGEQRLTRHPELLHRADSAPPTEIDHDPPTCVMTADEIAEVLSCS